MSNPTEAQIRVQVERSYAATVDRLAGAADFEDLKAAAVREGATTPDLWGARNRLWLAIEIQTPFGAWQEYKIE